METVTQFIFSQIQKDAEPFFTFLAHSCWVLAFLAPERNMEMNKHEQRNVLTGLFKVGLKKIIIKPKAELWLEAWGQTAPKISQNKL